MEEGNGGEQGDGGYRQRERPARRTAMCRQSHEHLQEAQGRQPRNELIPRGPDTSHGRHAGAGQDENPGRHRHQRDPSLRRRHDRVSNARRPRMPSRRPTAARSSLHSPLPHSAMSIHVDLVGEYENRSFAGLQDQNRPIASGILILMRARPSIDKRLPVGCNTSEGAKVRFVGGTAFVDDVSKR